MSIEVNNIVKKYNEQLAVNDISFKANKGQVLGFLGPNGAGKSTTMKIISNYIQADSGEVIVNGLNLKDNAMKIKSLIGYLPEHNPIYKDMYVKEYLEFVGNLYGVKPLKNRVNEVIEMTGLNDECHKLISSLSKGYRQRVGLAQAIIHDPELLILDEPTSGLDPNQLVEIRKLIKNLGKDKTVIFSTHIMQEVQAVCDRVIIINKGNLVADDSIEDLSNKIKGNTILTLEFDQKIDVNILKKLHGVLKVIDLQNNKYQVVTDQKLDLRKNISEICQQNKWNILELHKETVSVESIFQELTK